MAGPAGLFYRCIKKNGGPGHLLVDKLHCRPKAQMVAMEM